ncbi:MAG: hypothetical protein M1837_001136 [Sclerophora amabilis]|nr:MAG: hypothetical protein M1837_001136 [Sclerophora amabilis]
MVERLRSNALTLCRIGLPKNKITYISCCSYNGFALDEEGQAYGWGLNNYGQTGVPSDVAEGDIFIETPTIIENLKAYQIREIKGGTHHSIACTKDGKLMVWGRCDDSQLGIPIEYIGQDHIVFDSRNQPRNLFKPAVITDINAAFVAAGIDNSMAITEGGEVYS